MLTCTPVKEVEMNSIQELRKIGQSVWFDNINRSLIDSGRLDEMIALGLGGMTSNPTIFDKSISGSNDYDSSISRLKGRPTFEVYDELTIADIKDAADKLMSVYKKTDGLDGYVSLEVNPHLSHNTKETIDEAVRLFRKVGRPNLMIKIPATKEGFPAITRVISQGINVNATLIFSRGQYRNTAKAFVEGLLEFDRAGGDVKMVASVASIFVSRIDTLTDKLIGEKLSSNPDKELEALRGGAAVANSKLIYQDYKKIFSAPDWMKLFKKGARVQRVLWASTGTKDPSYSDVKYVIELVGKDTVNTVPDKTWAAFLDHGVAKDVVFDGVKEAEKLLSGLKNKGIDIDKVCSKLLEDGLVSFEKSFDSLLTTIEKKTPRS
jgi:transaldolase/glucose-6-phosphate isomerase